MSVQEFLGTIGERLSATANVKSVYGDPITTGQRTVIPVATIRYGFGGGVKGLTDKGGGGGVIARPSGALEITPQGTRFVPFSEPKTVGIAFAMGVVAGAILASLGGPKRIEIVRQMRR